VSKSSVTVAAREQELVDRARAETGLDDLGVDTWREGLEVLLQSALTEAHLNELGEHMFYDSIVRALTNRLQIEDWYGRHPEIEEQQVEVELLGVGFPRTGSTALAALLGEDTGIRPLRTWEAPAPCPPPGISPEDDRARLATAEAVIGAQHSMAARLRSMLPQSASGPLEDHDLMSLEFKAQVFLTAAWIPSYGDWFLECDMEPMYHYELRVLKLLQWKCPPNRWQLKSPTHTLFLDAFEKVFPEARFVMTHRDVSKVLPSVSDLYFTLLQMGSEDIDPVAVGELNMRQWGAAIDRVLAFRASGRDDKFYDIGYTTFQADPIAEIRALYDWLGRELTPDTEERMRAWRADNPRDKHGSHQYDGAEFGLTDARLAERFGAYRERFRAYLD
jgi:sulfotransferase family protein